MSRTILEKNICVECKSSKRPVRYWGSNLCEECFRKLLSQR